MGRDLRFDHLRRLSTPTGLFEHALLDQPRSEHGMCVDDVARALVVTTREPSPSPTVAGLTEVYLAFVLAAVEDDGLAHNRRTADGAWEDEAGTDDHWGRALWALASAAVHAVDPDAASRARVGAVTLMGARSPHVRAMCYAALGAAELLRTAPDHLQARRLLHDVRRLLRPMRHDTAWPWPYGRLTYANAVIPQAMIVVGRHLDAPELERDGLALLAWLVDVQTRDGHLSPVAVGGRGEGEPRHPYDQQPIEIAALAEAAVTALDATGDRRWADLLESCVAWFEGANDCGLPMRDAETGAGYDGLEDGTVNQNRGAESTLAWLATVQLSLRLVHPGVSSRA